MFEQILEFLTAHAGTIGIIGGLVIEVLSRIFPTKLPGSILRKVLVSVPKKVIAILEAAVGIFDKILPDKQA